MPRREIPSLMTVLRRRKKMRQIDLALAIESHQSAISVLEDGVQVFSEETTDALLVKIASVLGWTGAPRELLLDVTSVKDWERRAA